MGIDYYGSRYLSCFRGYNILILSATYGSSRYDCFLPFADTTAQVKRVCSGRYCYLYAKDNFFNNRNPCPDIPSAYDYTKILNVTYTCVLGKLF